MDSVVDSCENAMAETIIGLYKTEGIRQLAPWRKVDHVEVETLIWGIGSATGGCWGRSEMSHQRSLKRSAIEIRRVRPWGPDSDNGASGEPEAIY